MLGLVVDVSKLDQVEGLAAATVERFGRVDVVCNNAGVAGLGDPWFSGIQSWEWAMGVNFWGVVYGVRAFLPHLIASGGGHIVNTASIAGIYPGFSPAYDASKHAVVAITEGLFHAMQTAGIPIGVSCLCPGWVRTSILDAQRNWPDELGAPPTTNLAGEIVRKHVSRAIDEGMQPGAVADKVLEAVQAGRFWIFPNPEFLDIAVERFHRIAEQLDPVRTRPMPGMPETDQIVAEVVAAMSAQESP